MVQKGKYIYDWPRPMVTVDAAVFSFAESRAKILLIKRNNEPFKGKWALPGGFVEMDEQLGAAAARELAEEAGVTGIELKQVHTFGSPDRDPRGRNITILFMGVVPDELPEIKAGDDAIEAEWFDVDDVPAEMAFDHNQEAAMAIEKLGRSQ